MVVLIEITMMISPPDWRGVQTERNRREWSGNSTLKINVNGAMTRDLGVGGANGASGAAQMKRLKCLECLARREWSIWSDANKVENIQLFRRHRAATSNQRWVQADDVTSLTYGCLRSLRATKEEKLIVAVCGHQVLYDTTTHLRQMDRRSTAEMEHL